MNKLKILSDIQKNSDEIPVSYLLSEIQSHQYCPKNKVHNPKDFFGNAKVYNFGREVSTLVNEEKIQGSYETEFHGRGISSGTYFYKFQSEKYTEIKKMVLVK